MQTICKPDFGDAFREALSQACAQAHAHIDEFAEVLSEHYASEDAAARGYVSAGRPYGHTPHGAAQWYAERALCLCLTALAEQHTTHHANMAVTMALISMPAPPGKR